MQQNPNPNPHGANNYSYHVNSNPHQLTTIVPHGALLLNQLRPPGTDPPYVPPPIAVQYPISYEPQQGVSATPAGYYQQDPNAASATAYYQDPNASWLAAHYAAGLTTTNPAIVPQKRNNKLKGPMKTTFAQSSWCEVCKICCNSKDVLDKHELGKKHKRNLEQLKEKLTGVPPPASVPLPAFTSAPKDKPTIGPEEKPTKLNPTNSQKAARKKASSVDLETKRRRVLEGGAAATTVRVCNICNVVCNSDTVFYFHLAGQKHASMVKQHALGAAAAPAM